MVRQGGAIVTLVVLWGLVPSGSADHGPFCIEDDGNTGTDAPDTRETALFLSPGYSPHNCVGPGIGDLDDWFQLEVPADRQAYLTWIGPGRGSPPGRLAIEINGGEPLVSGVGWGRMPVYPASTVVMHFDHPYSGYYNAYSIKYEQVAQPLWDLEIRTESRTPRVYHATIMTSNWGVAAGDAKLLIKSWSGSGEGPSCLIPIRVEPGATLETLVHVVAPEGALLSARPTDHTPGFWGSDYDASVYLPRQVGWRETLGPLGMGGLGDFVDDHTGGRVQPRLSCAPDDAVLSKL